MKKIPLLFALEFDDKGNRVISDDIDPRAEILFDSFREVNATIKYDGTATMLDDDGNWFTRRSVKPGKIAPEGFVLAETDPNTGISFGWERAETSPFRKMLNKAIESFPGDPEAGTYELIGPKINGNPERVTKDTLVPHGCAEAEGFPDIEDISRNRDNLKEFLFPFFTDFRDKGIEGIVFWVDGVPSVKIRVKDFFPEIDSRFIR